MVPTHYEYDSAVEKKMEPCFYKIIDELEAVRLSEPRRAEHEQTNVTGLTSTQNLLVWILEPWSILLFTRSRGREGTGNTQGGRRLLSQEFLLASP